MVDRGLGDLRKGAHRVVHVAVAQQERPEGALQGLDAVVHVRGLQAVEFEAQKDGRRLHAPRCVNSSLVLCSRPDLLTLHSAHAENTLAYGCSSQLAQSRAQHAHLVIKLVVGNDGRKPIVDVPQLLEQRVALLVLVDKDCIAGLDL